MKKIALIVIGFGIIFSGCASSSGIVPTGPDSYMVSRSAAWGNANAGSVLADDYQEANEFCEKSGRKMTPVNSNTVPMYFGHRPEAQLDFMCLDPNDPQLGRTRMVPVSPAPASVH